MDDNEIVITGSGAVSPAGVGKKVLFDAFQNNVSGIGRITKFPSPSNADSAGEINNFRHEEYIKDKKFRRIADISRYAIVSAMSAVSDAGIELRNYAPERIGLVLCVTHGAIGYSSLFHKGLLEEGPQGASPLLFSDSVLNAPAGNVSNYFGIKGPVYTLIGGSASAIEAIRTAQYLLESDKIDCCFAGAAEELNEMVFHTYRRFGLNLPVGEGAGMVILERNGRTMHKRKYGIVQGTAAGFCCDGAADELYAKTINKCLIKSDILTGDITDIFANHMQQGSAAERLFMSSVRRPQIKNIANLFGEAFCVTTVFHIILASMLCGNGLPQLRNALISAFSLEGSAAALILSNEQDKA